MNILNYINRAKDGIITSVLVISCALFWSCSFSDDDLVTTALEPDEEIAIPVIVTEGDAPLLVNLDKDNYNEKIRFYFYDANGNYITHGEIDPNTDTSWNEGSGNIEVQSADLVVLTGLTDTSLPKYVIAIVNEPDVFTHTDKLEDMLTLPSTADNSGIGTIGVSYNNFVMTSSTYIPSSGTAPYSAVPYQFYTEISSSNFVQVGETPTENQILSIPVERLAAKVTVNLTASNTTTISGAIGSGESTSHTVYQVNTNPLQYVELLGWKLNAVARDSYLFKNLDKTWVSTDPWSGWNDATNTRCYWAKSYYYGLDDYPKDNSAGITPTQEESSSTWLSQYVKYVSLDDEYDSELLSIYNGDGYCPENTNKAGEGEIIEDGTSTSLTCVLIKARAWEYDNENDKFVPLERSTGNSEGLMYYSLPIQHSNYIGGSTIQQGEYGVVRNHHYTVTITAVNNLGTAVGDDTGIVIVPEYSKGASLTGLSALWSSHEETINNGEEEFIDVTPDDD